MWQIYKFYKSEMNWMQSLLGGGNQEIYPTNTKRVRSKKKKRSRNSKAKQN